MGDEIILIRKAPKKLSPYVRHKVLAQVSVVSDFVNKWMRAETEQNGDELAAIIENLAISPLAHLQQVDSVHDVSHLLLEGPLQWVETLYATWPFKGLALREDPDNAHGLIVVAGRDVQLNISASYTESNDAWHRLTQVIAFGLGPTLNIR